MSGLPGLRFGGGKARSIAGGDVSEAILDDGSLMLWGFGYQGWTHAGLPPDDFATLSAMKMGASRKVKASDVDVYHACAITDDGALSCWGFAPHGALGLGSVVASDGPVVYNEQGLQVGTTSVDLGGRARCKSRSVRSIPVPSSTMARSSAGATTRAVSSVSGTLKIAATAATS